MAIATRPKRPAHHKKRIGKHHKHNQPYLKAYWPYLPMLAIVGLGLFVNSLWSSGNVLGIKSDLSPNSLLSVTNSDRLSHKLGGLTIDGRLSAAAQAKALDMVKTDYWAHTAPDGKTPWYFITSSGYQYEMAGENLAYGFDNSEDTVRAWMNSPEHRANILNGGYRNVGFGVAEAADYQGRGPATVIVAEYGKPAGDSQTAEAQPQAVAAARDELPAQPVSRMELVAQGRADWSLLVISALTGAALAVFIVRHGLQLHRLLSRGEAFMVHHPYLDIGIVFIITVGLLLTHTVGLIR